MKKIMLSILFQIVIIGHNNNYQDALIAKKYLIKEMNIPEKFISIKNSKDPCKLETSFLHLCIDKNKEIQLMKYDAERTKEIFNKE